MKPRRFCSHSSEQDITNLSLAQKAGANILSAAASCRIDSLESAGDASSPAAVEARCWEAPKGIDAEAHRYPHCLVWTPIPLLSWLCPYIGHVGLCDSEGRVLDFAGPFYVGIDSMLFDWPTRYIQLHLDDAQLEQTKSWDQARVERHMSEKGSSSACTNHVLWGADVATRVRSRDGLRGAVVRFRLLELPQLSGELPQPAQLWPRRVRASSPRLDRRRRRRAPLRFGQVRQLLGVCQNVGRELGHLDGGAPFNAPFQLVRAARGVGVGARHDQPALHLVVLSADCPGRAQPVGAAEAQPRWRFRRRNARPGCDAYSSWTQSAAAEL
uniref:Uncharacterized protein n=1 Tax=Chrysotila carterae TaxID=13221 RepID=A0A7S4B668_CHRCT